MTVAELFPPVVCSCLSHQVADNPALLHSHYVCVPAGMMPSDVLMSSPIIQGEGGAPVSHFTEFGGIDPTMDPELAAVLATPPHNPNHVHTTLLPLHCCSPPPCMASSHGVASCLSRVCLLSGDACLAGGVPSRNDGNRSASPSGTDPGCWPCCCCCLDRCHGSRRRGGYAATGAGAVNGWRGEHGTAVCTVFPCRAACC